MRDGRRALLIWEVGGGGGHIVALQRVGAALKARGLAVDLAALRLDRVDPRYDSHDRLLQAPVLPALCRRDSEAGPSRDYADVLYGIGFGDADIVARQVLAWRTLFDLVRPDVIVTDYSPGAVLAARGRIPTVATGAPASAPIGRDGQFPRFVPEPTEGGGDGIAVLPAINAALARLNEPPAADLPNAVVPTTCLCQGFTELDPYAAIRTEPPVPPFVEQSTGSTGQGRDVVVYLWPGLKNDPVVVAALLGLRRPVRMDEGGLQPEPRSFLEKGGAQLSPRLIDAEEMAKSAAVLVSHGGFNTTVRGLIAGVPQVIIATDREKLFYGSVIEKLGVGLGLPRAKIGAPELGAAIRRVADDPSYGERARALAPEFRQRHADGNGVELMADRIVQAMA